jgi:hypothetical protein
MRRLTRYLQRPSSYDRSMRFCIAELRRQPGGELGPDMERVVARFTFGRGIRSVKITNQAREERVRRLLSGSLVVHSAGMKIGDGQYADAFRTIKATDPDYIDALRRELWRFSLALVSEPHWWMRWRSRPPAKP